MTDAEAEVRTATTSFTCYWTEAWESSIEKVAERKRKPSVPPVSTSIHRLCFRLRFLTYTETERSFHLRFNQ